LIAAAFEIQDQLPSHGSSRGNPFGLSYLMIAALRPGRSP
jgi:hypothetical protein